MWLKKYSYVGYAVICASCGVLYPLKLSLFLDLATYTIIAEENAGQYYPDYAYNHPLFTKDMKIYISYDSTNKNSQAGSVEIVEYGKPKVDMGFPVFNYAVGYDVNNREPLFYEKYPGSIVDVSQLKLMLNKAEGYGYKKVGVDP